MLGKKSTVQEHMEYLYGKSANFVDVTASLSQLWPYFEDLAGVILPGMKVPTDDILGIPAKSAEFGLWVGTPQFSLTLVVWNINESFTYGNS